MAHKKIQLIGLSDIHIAPIVAERLEECPDSSLIVTPSFERARSLAKNLSFFTDRRILLLPEDDPFFFSVQAKSRSAQFARTEALISLQRNDGAVVISPVSAAIRKMSPPAVFAAGYFSLRVGGVYEISELQRGLTGLGYERVPLVENKGEFAVRGGIFDLFPPDLATPVRVDFFGDEIESIRNFDPETQKSGDRSDEVFVYPAAEPGLAEDATDFNLLADYLPRDGMLFSDDPDRAYAAVELRYKEALADFGALAERGVAAEKAFADFSGTDELRRLYQSRDSYFFTPFARKPEGVERISEKRNYLVRQPAVIGGNMELFVAELRRYAKKNYEITIVCSSQERLSNLRGLLDAEKLAARVQFVRGTLASGTELISERKVWLWDGDIFRTGRQKRSAPALKDRSPIRSYSEIKNGDYVVHENHGIGKFLGIEEKTVQGSRRDYLKIKYAGEDFLYVPVDQMSLVQKYIGGGETPPKIGRLSGTEWKNAKAKARADIAEMAGELVALSAQRKAGKGYAFSPDTVWQKEFEDKFPYEETEDQLRCIDSIKRGMEQPTPMDHLLCGDVGYGKTEVALRAVFKCAADGKQAAVLAPTTILARQHYATFTERFADFPFSVEMLSRFRSKAEQEKTIQGLAKGTVDVVIGTHRLLSADVRFHDLGLLVVDEEQRFGVKHKERIKSMKSDVDVLTLTATPIPRTLHMSLLGLRDMDLIAEPPEDRYPVQTYVMEEDEEIIRETIRRELEREGQVYAVVSRISSIDRICADIARLVPEATVAAGHGRMNEHELENVMMDFIDGKYDILVSTTIIESGIDIPNVNTIIIFDSDHFGLSQLYQLRGRVGRSNRIAFAYLLYRRDKIVSEVAEKRLRTIREFTEFGAGFKIAMRDLEIRGAGNLLGAQQHGHMMTIGYELYCKMVDEAVHALSGAEPAEVAEVQIDLPVSAYIPDTYIADESLKLQAYKEIALIENETEYQNVAAELEDRYGQLPPPAACLIRVSWMRCLAGKTGIRKIAFDGGELVFHYVSGDRLRPQGVAAAFDLIGERLSVSGTRVPSLRLSTGNFPRDAKETSAMLDEVIGVLMLLGG